MNVHRKSGIYSRTNRKNGKFYIGSAVDIGNRWAVHRMSLRQNKSGCRKLQNAWNKHGEDCFLFEVVELVPEKARLIEHEQMYLDLLSPQYNICKKAGSALGVKHSPETRKKMSDSHSGERNYWFGVTADANPLFGRCQPEHLKKLWSEMRQGEKNPMFGVTPKHAKLSVQVVQEIRMLIGCGLRNKEIAEFYGLSKSNVSHIRRGRSYRGVP